MHKTLLKSEPAGRIKTGQVLSVLGIVVMSALLIQHLGLMVASVGAFMLGMGLALSWRAKMRERRAERRARHGARPGNLYVNEGENLADCNATRAYPHRAVRTKLIPTA